MLLLHYAITDTHNFSFLSTKPKQTILKEIFGRNTDISVRTVDLHF